jgi:hypothetical protein
MKSLMLICIFAIVIVSSYGQVIDNSTHKDLAKEVGLNMGATTGVGISFRHWFDNNGVQITLLPVKTDEMTLMSGSLSLLRSFKLDRSFRFFGYMGHHLFRYKGSEEDLRNLFPAPLMGFDISIGDNTKQLDYTHYNIGVGVGISLGRIIGFNAQLGYGAFDVLGQFNLYPTGEMGLFYRF